MEAFPLHPSPIQVSAAAFEVIVIAVFAASFCALLVAVLSVAAGGGGCFLGGNGTSSLHLLPDTVGGLFGYC